MRRTRGPVGALLLAGLLLGLWASASAQSPAPAAGRGKRAAGGKASDFELVEKLLTARREYQNLMEQLRAYYIGTGDLEKARRVEEELVQYHRIPKHPYILGMEVPPPTLQGNINIPEANELYRRAMLFKDKGWGTDYNDNQRRAELLFQQLLTNYPQSDKIGDAAYQLGDIYESKAFRHYDRAAAYFERCYEWNPKTQLDARLRAAHLYDRNLNERNKAIEIYKDITTHETDAKRLEEANRRLSELGAKR
jgi:tetratricopeptide (TPR) repeat protein